MVLVHIMRGMTNLRSDGYSQHSMVPGPQSALFAAEMNSLCKTVLNSAMRRPLFVLLSHSFNFAFWSPEFYPVLKKIVSFWVDLITPWKVPSDELQSFLEIKKKKYTKAATSSSTPAPKPAAGTEAPNGSPGSSKAVDPAVYRPVDWQQTVERTRRVYVADMFALIGPLVSAFLNRAARAPVQYEAWLRMAETVSIALQDTTLRELVFEMEDTVARKDTDRTPDTSPRQVRA